MELPVQQLLLLKQTNEILTKFISVYLNPADHPIDLQQNDTELSPFANRPRNATDYGNGTATPYSTGFQPETAVDLYGIFAIVLAIVPLTLYLLIGLNSAGTFYL